MTLPRGFLEGERGLGASGNLDRSMPGNCQDSQSSGPMGSSPTATHVSSESPPSGSIATARTKRQVSSSPNKVKRSGPRPGLSLPSLRCLTRLTARSHPHKNKTPFDMMEKLNDLSLARCGATALSNLVDLLQTEACPMLDQPRRS